MNPDEDQETDVDDQDDHDNPRYEDGSVIDPPPEPNPTTPDTAK